MLNGWILPIGGVASERVCACSLRSRLVFILIRNAPQNIPQHNHSIYCHLPHPSPSTPMPGSPSFSFWMVNGLEIIRSPILIDVLIIPPRLPWGLLSPYPSLLFPSLPRPYGGRQPCGPDLRGRKGKHVKEGGGVCHWSGTT